MEDVKKASGLSTAALVTGIFAFIPGCSLAALICGIMDLVKINNGQSSRAGKGKDIAGIVLAFVMPIVLVIIILVSGGFAAMSFFNSLSY